MRILNVRMFFGTELILRYNSLFEQILNAGIVDIINCAICEDTVRVFRNTFDKDFARKYTEIAKFIMTDSRINVSSVHDIEKSFPNDEQFKKCLHPEVIEKDFNIKETYTHTGIVDNSIETSLPEKYITISSKCLNVPKVEYELNKNNIFKILNSLEIPVVILGERESKKCVEYDIHETYSIYEDLMQNIKNKIDLSIESSNNNNDLYPLKKTFKVSNKSLLNILLARQV